MKKTNTGPELTSGLRILLSGLLALTMLGLAPGPADAQEKRKLAVGYFPNVTHAHALIAQNMAAEGQGWFESRLPEVELVWRSFNAGPSAMESLFAKAVDLTYVGPNPALNAFIRSDGGVVVASGAVRGGAGLVVSAGSRLTELADFRGKSIATPQLGNTQDIACRFWLSQAGLKVALTGGEVNIIPTSNPSILPLFIQGKIDAAWTVEPWVSRLEMEGGGKLIFSEPAESSLTTVLSVAARFDEDNPELVDRFVAAHRELTDWIRENPQEARRRVAAELTRQMRREFPLELVEHAWPRLVFDNAVGESDFQSAAKAALAAGFLKKEPAALDRLVRGR